MLQISKLEAVAAAPHAADGVPKHPRMTIATWNLADFEQAPPDGVQLAPHNVHRMLRGWSVTKRSSIADVMEEVGADVYTTNEDIEFNETSQGNALSIPGYTKVAACRAEALWSSEPAYKYGGRYLQNAIYIRDATVTFVQRFTKNISKPEVVGDYVRCTAVADLRMKGSKESQLVRVAAVHLTGGRFVDMQFLHYEGEKGHEIEEALMLKPDVLVGDFNSYPSATQVHQFQQAYEPYVGAKKNGTLNQYVDWAVEGTKKAEQASYLRLDNFMNTTKYGGTVDQFFFKPARKLKDLSFKVLGGDIAGNFELSDHNMVKTVIELPR